MTVPHCPHLPEPPTPIPSTGIPLSSLAQVRGILKKSVMESMETYFFLRSWEQRGQNLKPSMEERRVRQAESKRSLGARSHTGHWDSPASSCHSCHSPFPSRLGCQPHTGKVEPLNGTLEKEDGRQSSGRDLSRVEGRAT